MQIVAINHTISLISCSRVWDAVEPSLAPHLRRYARNFGLVQKSKEEMSIDMSLRATVQEMLDNALSSDPLGDDGDFADEEAVQDMYDKNRSRIVVLESPPTSG
jgi:hypothetical protein